MQSISSGKKPFLTGQWRRILMFSYKVAPEALMPFVPRGVQVETWDNTSFVSLVALCFEESRVLGLRLPVPSYAQVNLRLYVTHGKGTSSQRGVVFFKEIVPLRRISLPARLLFRQQYETLPLAYKGDQEINGHDEQMEYRIDHPHKWLRMRGTVHGDLLTPQAGSKEAFILERYWGVAKQGEGLLGFRVKHPPWGYRQVHGARVVGNISALYGEQFASFLRQEPDVALQAEGGEASVSWPVRVMEL